ncbi:TetR/AcrR family transcriptional regulator [Candidatus Pantoea soli]|uniref:TetR/AcrR family transcriptional regulator n=1 Tax=Candidatus Pantoea soli TaxID=3098669 RepID=A0A518XJ93_9GAMM|nr:TetR/AcrR family transcriptional regulator [Pantoea soli]QDY44239.1 TetR/AcrR family transcriptional regulator [Pantoea soli]
MKPETAHLKRQARHKIILDAARRCFEEKGLHGTTMAYVASEAGLSVGQVYRIFDSKEEIIEEIVSEIISARVKKMLEDNHDLHNKAAILSGLSFAYSDSRRDDYLLMEINAESTRNPRLRQILKKADDRLKQEGGKLMRMSHPQLTDDNVQLISEFIAVLTEGALYRQGLQDEFAHKTDMRDLYLAVFEFIFHKNTLNNEHPSD